MGMGKAQSEALHQELLEAWERQNALALAALRSLAALYSGNEGRDAFSPGPSARGNASLGKAPAPSGPQMIMHDIRVGEDARRFRSVEHQRGGVLAEIAERGR